MFNPTGVILKYESTPTTQGAATERAIDGMIVPPVPITNLPLV